MSTGLFELMKTVKQPEMIIGYLDSASYDELLEIDLNTQAYKSVFHITNKYKVHLSHGSFRSLFTVMSEELIHPDDRERFVELMNPDTLMHTLNSSDVTGLCCEEFRLRLISGDWRWVEIALLSSRAYGLEPGVIRVYFFDCHSRKVRELGLSDQEQPEYSAHDRNEMTGLLIKSAFLSEAQRQLETKDSDDKWCLVSIDVENFKLFNEWYGHSEGDLLMVQIGAALQEMCDENGGTAGYFGQDDFCLLIPYDMEQIANLFEDIASLTASRGNSAGFLPAFGVSVVEDGCAIMDLLDRAFLAMEEAKGGYHKRIRTFDKSMYLHTDAEYHMLSDFLGALRRREVTFYLQPLCNATTNKIVGAEALTRWIKSDGAVVPPDVFIPILEKRGLISDLDMYIWEEVCRWQRSMIDRGYTPVPVSVNVSVGDILHTDLAAVFDHLTEKYKIDHKLIKIEITESSYITNITLVRSTVRTLREKGFTVLMDDFGSGYSTLNMLKNLNIDIIKLDAAFLNVDEGDEEKSIRILESVTNMTKTIGVPIIIEGVETEEQTAFLKGLGCNYIQGYYYYRPMPIPEFEALIEDPDIVDRSGVTFKHNQQFSLRELLDNNIYSDSMLNNIIGPCAFYSWNGEEVDIVRYNEQFYETVNVPDFTDRLADIRRFMPKADLPRIAELLTKAQRDRFNGAQGILHFYKTDGTLTTYFMHFYYLHTEGECKIYYGSVQNITKLSLLEKQMSLLSHYSTDTVIYLTKESHGDIHFTVLFNGLENEIGMSAHELEINLNSEDLFDRIGSENNISLYREILKKINHTEPFTAQMNMKKANGEPLTLRVQGNYLQDDTNTTEYIIIMRKQES